ncbi:hypothetical protein ACM1RC_28275 [Paenibacillus azoreducens]|uniref:hypothetical protein n=1 Tax=Paenibacillus azoreducens TaxID=116718 RepID=UPI0039F4FCEE
MDNRQIHVSGLTAQNQNITFGDHSTINQNIQQLSENEIDTLFKELKKFALENSDERDVKAVETIEDNVKQSKLEIAKTIFDLLTKTVQASAAGVAISKAFGWL